MITGLPYSNCRQCQPYPNSLIQTDREPVIEYPACAVPGAFDRINREVGERRSSDEKCVRPVLSAGIAGERTGPPLSIGTGQVGSFGFDLEQGYQEMAKAGEDRPKHQLLSGGVPTEQENSSRIPFGIDLDDLYGGKHYAKEILGFRPCGIVPFVGRFVAEFRVIDATVLVTIESYLPDDRFG